MRWTSRLGKMLSMRYLGLRLGSVKLDSRDDERGHHWASLPSGDPLEVCSVGKLAFCGWGVNAKIVCDCS